MLFLGGIRGLAQKQTFPTSAKGRERTLARWSGADFPHLGVHTLNAAARSAVYRR